MHQSQASQKRESFRQQIRRKQIESLFQQKRKEKTIYTLSETQLDPVNEQLIRRSLSKNQLLPDVRQHGLLEALAQKISNKASVGNLQFVMSVLGNLLLDDLVLEEKQAIFELGWKWHQFEISPLIWVSFWQGMIWNAYGNIEETKQISIQNVILPKMLDFLKRQYNPSLISNQISQDSYHQTLTEEIIASFHYFFQGDNDHNNTLVYKAKRNLPIIMEIVQWANAKNFDEMTQIMQQTKLTTIAIFKDLTELDIPMFVGDVALRQDLVTKIGQFVLKELQVQGEYRALLNKNGELPFFNQDISQQIIAQIFLTLIGILPDQTDMGEPTLPLHQRDADNLISEIQREQTKVPLLIKLKAMVEVVNGYGISNKRSPLQYRWQELISAIIRILRVKQEHTQPDLLKICFQLVCSVLEKGFEEGNSDYKVFLKSCGGTDILQHIYLGLKNQELSELYSCIDNYLDIC